MRQISRDNLRARNIFERNRPRYRYWPCYGFRFFNSISYISNCMNCSELYNDRLFLLPHSGIDISSFYSINRMIAAKHFSWDQTCVCTGAPVSKTNWSQCRSYLLIKLCFPQTNTLYKFITGITRLICSIYLPLQIQDKISCLITITASFYVD